MQCFEALDQLGLGLNLDENVPDVLLFDVVAFPAEVLDHLVQVTAVGVLHDYANLLLNHVRTCTH